MREKPCYGRKSTVKQVFQEESYNEQTCSKTPVNDSNLWKGISMRKIKGFIIFGKTTILLIYQYKMETLFWGFIYKKNNQRQD